MTLKIYPRYFSKTQSLENVSEGFGLVVDLKINVNIFLRTIQFGLKVTFLVQT